MLIKSSRPEFPWQGFFLIKESDLIGFLHLWCFPPIVNGMGSCFGLFPSHLHLSLVNTPLQRQPGREGPAFGPVRP